MMFFSSVARPSARWRIAGLGLLAAALVNCGSDDPSAPQLGFLELSDQTITFNTEQHGANPETQTVEVTNSGPGTITDLDATVTYEPGEPTGWLTATLSEETTPATLTLTPATASLPGGIHTATVSIAGADALNDPEHITVTFRVAPMFGYPIEGSETITLADNTLYGLPILVPSPTELVSVNFIVKAVQTPGTVARVVLYADNLGNPGSMIVATQLVTITVGRNQIPVSMALQSGTYWFMLVLSQPAHLAAGSGQTVDNKYITHPYASAPPNPFPGHITQLGWRMNFFLKTAPQE